MPLRWVFVLPVLTTAAACNQPASDGEGISPIRGSVSVANEVVPAQPGATDWPWWFGPNRDNVAARDQAPPVRWSETENVLWKIDVPGRGHGSPCIWGDHIYLPTADDKEEVQYVVCYERSTGKKLWQREVHRGEFMRSHRKGSHASSTPACDGHYVFMPFMVQGGVWLTALNLDGTIAWQKQVGKFKSMHGFAASPLIYKSLVFILADSVKGAFIAAVHRRSGDIVWKVARPEYRLGSYASPIAGRVAGRDQLLVHGPHKVFSYDPADGSILWTCDGPSELTSNTMNLGHDMVFASGGFPRKSLLAIRADGSGDVTDTHVVWSKKKKTSYVTSMALADGLLYMVEDGGAATCFEAANGTVVWNTKLKGDFSSSPVVAGGHIYVANEKGAVYVFKAGREFELVAQNDLADGGFASPVICDGRIYLRTLHHLYCLGSAH